MATLDGKHSIPAIGRVEFIAIIATLMALNALAIDIMLPAFPNIAAGFDLDDPTRVQFVLLSYIIGFGVAQLVYGPFSDRFGRRAPLLVGMALYILFAIAGAYAPSFEFLLASRFIQGLGAAGTRVIAISIVRDTHSGRAMASTMSLVMMVFMAVPSVAPLAGQAIIHFGDWHLIFLFMAIVALAAGMWMWLRLPETLPAKNRRPLTAKSVALAFHLVLSNRISLFYMLATAFYFGSLFAFLNLAQPVYVDIYGLGSWFPVTFSLVAGVMALASFANSRLVGHFGQRHLSHAALIAFCAISFAMAVLASAGPVSFAAFFTSVMFLMPLFGFVGANFNSIAMEPLGAVAGTASSVLGFTQTVVGGLVGALIGQAYDGTIVPLTGGFAAVSVIALVLVLIAEKGRLFGTGTPSP